MKIQFTLLLLLVALQAHAQTVDEHAGHTNPTDETESVTDAAASANNTSSAVLHDHSDAAAETTATHEHGVDPAAAVNSGQQISHDHESETAQPATAHVRGTQAAATEQATPHVHGSEPAQSAAAHIHETAPTASASAVQLDAAHIHEAEPVTAANSAQTAPHEHDSETLSATTHVHETAPAASANTAQPVAVAHVHEAETASPVSATLPADESAAMQQARHMNMMMHGNMINTYLIAERFEHVRDDGRDSLEWEMQGWVGRDINKFWFKTEGAYDTDSNNSDEVEVQALYSRAVAPYWDMQAGVRVDNGFGPSRTYAVLGLQGLAPYWFELDAAAFVSERGDLSTRLEAEYDLRFTQRLLLQPRLEVNYAFADDVAIGAGDGLRDASFGLRLRYEIRREFAPYIGLEWHKAYGDTATYLGRRGDEPDAVSVVAGVRIWY